MTLSVDVFLRDPVSAEVTYVPTDETRSDLAGFEVCRQTLWGAPRAIAAGLTILPELRTTAVIWVDYEDLGRLEHECDLLDACAEDLAEEEAWDVSFVRRKVKNVRDAIGHARAIGGGVTIG